MRTRGSLSVLACVLTWFFTPNAAQALKFELQNPFRFFRFESDYAAQRMAFDLVMAHGGLRDRSQVDPQLLERELNTEDFWLTAVSAELKKQFNWPKSWRGSTPLQIIEGLRAEEKRLSISDIIGTIPGRGKLRAKEVITQFGWATLLDTNGSPDTAAVCWDRVERLHADSCPGYTVPTSWIGRIFDESHAAGSCRWELTGGAKFRSNNAAVLQADCDEIYVDLAAARDDGRIFGSASITRVDAAGASLTLSLTVTDKLVAALGDSFTSGEGNPDRPVIMSPKLTALGTPLPRRPDDGSRWAAAWIDRSCHRSAYSWQIRSALQQTLVDPSTSVTLLALGCSGAEVVEGLLFPWSGVETLSKPGLFRSQLGALYDELCVAETRVNAGAIPPREIDTFLQGVRPGNYPWVKNEKSFGDRVMENLRCKSSKQRFNRSIDAVLLGIGGNDVGFAKWIAAAITDGLPQLAAKGFIPRLENCKQDPAACNLTRARLARLTSRYRVLKRVLTERVMVDFRVAPSKIIVVSYPKAVSGADGNVCPNGNGGMTVSVIPPKNSGVLEIRDNRELQTIESFRADHLVPMLKSFTTSEPAFSFVNGFVEATAHHGFCATTLPDEAHGRRYGSTDLSSVSVPANDIAETLHTPRVGESVTNRNGIVTTPDPWRPFPPEAWRPYAPRARWFRTPNDVFMTIDNKPSRVQEQTAIGILDIGSRGSSGAFHPTAAAHAAVVKSAGPALAEAFKR